MNWKTACKVFPGDECCIKKQINRFLYLEIVFSRWLYNNCGNQLSDKIG